MGFFKHLPGKLSGFLKALPHKLTVGIRKLPGKIDTLIEKAAKLPYVGEAIYKSTPVTAYKMGRAALGGPYFPTQSQKYFDPHNPAEMAAFERDAIGRIPGVKV
jgi:hypothetical protein